MDIEFIKLNDNWNAEPNAVEPKIEIENNDLRISFELNPFIFDHISEGDIGTLSFAQCRKYRLGDTNDEGFYSGQCRFSKICPQWGEFYEIMGNDTILDVPSDWIECGGNGNRHFLFYFRDETFECKAQDWKFTYGNC